MALFSGGALLPGGVARTDLISPEQTEPLARSLYRVLHERILSLPDEVVVYPTHGGGSFCATSVGPERTTTIGRERATNPLLAAPDEDAFVAMLLAQFGSYPTYFRRLREVNRLGPRVYGEFPVLAPLDVAAVERLRLDGAEVIDVRPIEAFAAGHIPGSLSIALRPEFGSWLGWLAPSDRPLVFVLGPDQDRADLVRQALGIGYEQLAGELAGGIDAWREAGRPVAVTALTRTPSAGGSVLDVRQVSEFRSGHVRGAIGAGARFARRRRHRCPRWGHGHVRPRRASDDRRQPARTCWSPCLGLRRESRRLGAGCRSVPGAGSVTSAHSGGIRQE